MSLRIRLIFNFPHFQILAISIVLSLLGISQIVFAIVAFVQRIWGFYVGSGLWGGCASFLAGVAGIVAANTKGVCIVKTFLVTSLLSLLVAIPLMILSAGGLHGSSNFYRDDGVKNARRNHGSTKLIHGFLMAFSVVQMVLSVITFLVCLKHLYWNGRKRKKHRSKQLTKLRGGTGDHILGRPSTSSSHAPLVTSLGQRSRKKHRRRSGNHRHSGHDGDVFTNNPREHHHVHRHHSRSGHRPRQAPSQPDSMEHMNSSVSGGRQEMVESLEIQRLSHDSRPESNTVRSDSIHSVPLSRGEDNVSSPLPIDEDEELPPYEESLREIDGESVFPMSISENCSHSSSMSSSDELSSGDDNVDVEVWESVSQSHLRTNMNRRSDMGASPTATNPHHPESVSSLSHTMPAAPSVGNRPSSILSNSSIDGTGAMTDPQGVLYHGFSRNMDKIDNVNKERKTQRSRSFQCERALARENMRSSRSGNASVPNKEYQYNKDIRLSAIHGLDSSASKTVPLKPPRLSLVECTDTENKRIQSMKLDKGTSCRSDGRQQASFNAKPRVFSPPVLQTTSILPNSETGMLSNKKPDDQSKTTKPTYAAPVTVKDKTDRPHSGTSRLQPSDKNGRYNYLNPTDKGISLNPYFKPISHNTFVDPLSHVDNNEGNRLSKSMQSSKKQVPFPANISVEETTGPSFRSKHPASHPRFGTSSLSNPSYQIPSHKPTDCCMDTEYTSKFFAGQKMTAVSSSHQSEDREGLQSSVPKHTTMSQRVLPPSDKVLSDKRKFISPVSLQVSQQETMKRTEIPHTECSKPLQQSQHMKQPLQSTEQQSQHKQQQPQHAEQQSQPWQQEQKNHEPHTESTSQHRGPDSQHLHQPAHHTGQNTQHTGQPTQHTGQPTQHTGQPTRHTGQPTQHTGQPTCHTGQPTQHTGQPTQQTCQQTQYRNPQMQHTDEEMPHRDQQPLQNVEQLLHEPKPLSQQSTNHARQRPLLQLQHTQPLEPQSPLHVEQVSQHPPKHLPPKPQEQPPPQPQEQQALPQPQEQSPPRSQEHAPPPQPQEQQAPPQPQEQPPQPQEQSPPPQPQEQPPPPQPQEQPPPPQPQEQPPPPQPQEQPPPPQPQEQPPPPEPFAHPQPQQNRRSQPIYSLLL